MSELSNIFSDIANSIRTKTNNIGGGITPYNMANAINNIESASQSGIYLVSTTNLYRCNNGRIARNVITNNFSNQINYPVLITEGVTDCALLFSNCNFTWSSNLPIYIYTIYSSKYKLHV